MGRMRLLENGNGPQYEGFVLVKSAAVRQNSKGADYVDFILADVGGEAVAKLWDYKKEMYGTYEAGDVIKVRCQVTMWKDAEQLKIEKIRQAAPGEAEMDALVPCSPVDPMSAYAAILKTVTDFEDEDIKALTLKILSDNREKLLLYPAAVKLHHATRGGLLHHTLSVLKLARAVCEIYSGLNRDLLFAGVILHDIGKIREMKADETGLAGSYTDEGMLLGHISLGITEIALAAKELGTPENKAVLLEHMLLSHHGQPDFGSPKYPMFPEAEVLSEMDMLDSRLYEMFSALEGIREGGFTERLWALDNRQLFRASGKKETEADK